MDFSTFLKRRNTTTLGEILESIAVWKMHNVDSVVILGCGFYYFFNKDALGALKSKI